MKEDHRPGGDDAKRGFHAPHWAQHGNGRSLEASEFDRLLDELADDDLVSLPADFSRADIYIDHD